MVHKIIEFVEYLTQLAHKDWDNPTPPNLQEKEDPEFSILYKHNPSSNNRKHSLEYIVIHWSGNPNSFNGCVNWMCKPETPLSYHYLISGSGNIVQTVKESERAWHCGKSNYKGLTDMNSRSIGIALDGPPSLKGWKKWPIKQLKSLKWLIKEIRKEYPNIILVDHYMISPNRKKDITAGENLADKFNWKKLVKDTGVVDGSV